MILIIQNWIKYIKIILSNFFLLKIAIFLSRQKEPVKVRKKFQKSGFQRTIIV